MKPKIKTSFFCNRCGRYHECEPEDIDFTGNLFHDFHAYFGYSSPFDGDLLEFSLCELCLFEILRDFKHVPKLDGKNPVEAFDRCRTEKHPYYEDTFIKNYKEVEDLSKK
ncbi:hypothetical protein MHB50_18765 [Siminovitchia sp. FSL H7-0308]|uniref:Uncharacterized protein n=1 Tax=Siminovitchia thermophila TaxID=1245522 RepID=A0ABS2R9V0_9BACI|nr:hypothetical protein [Siminovitchia thermophila]MBM7716165.1 hypothetical protein [Siminovitchia thermophila]ONK21485.1 hypothetical protein BLX87_21770 [Bacillus sp. VT-16-64]